MNMAESNHTPAVLGIPTWTQNPHQSSNNTLTGFSLKVPTRKNFTLDKGVADTFAIILTLLCRLRVSRVSQSVIPDRLAIWRPITVRPPRRSNRSFAGSTAAIHASMAWTSGCGGGPDQAEI